MTAEEKLARIVEVLRARRDVSERNLDATLSVEPNALDVLDARIKLARFDVWECALADVERIVGEP